MSEKAVILIRDRVLQDILFFLRLGHCGDRQLFFDASCVWSSFPFSYVEILISWRWSTYDDNRGRVMRLFVHVSTCIEILFFFLPCLIYQERAPPESLTTDVFVNPVYIEWHSSKLYLSPLSPSTSVTASVDSLLLAVTSQLTQIGEQGASFYCLTSKGASLFSSRTPET